MNKRAISSILGTILVIAVVVVAVAIIGVVVMNASNRAEEALIREQCQIENQFDDDAYNKCLLERLGQSAVGVESCTDDLRCGDGFCSDGENPNSCFQDCGTCGDYKCQPYSETLLKSGNCGLEWGTCAVNEGDDCQCGDGFCYLRPEGNIEEDFVNCHGDCGSCGDGICGEVGYRDETPENCPLDCGTCGDGICFTEPIFRYSEPIQPGETPQSCWEDCGPYCGDGICNHGETTGDCPGDCPAERPCNCVQTAYSLNLRNLSSSDIIAYWGNLSGSMSLGSGYLNNGIELQGVNSSGGQRLLRLFNYDVKNYTDTGLGPNTAYYYKVRAYVNYSDEPNYCECNPKINTGRSVICYGTYSRLVGATTLPAGMVIAPSARFANGDGVITNAAVNAYVNPYNQGLGSQLITSQTPGLISDEGILGPSPLNVGGVWYWFVEFNATFAGWVNENYLDLYVSGTTPPSVNTAKPIDPNDIDSAQCYARLQIREEAMKFNIKDYVKVNSNFGGSIGKCTGTPTSSSCSQFKTQYLCMNNDYHTKQCSWDGSCKGTLTCGAQKTEKACLNNASHPLAYNSKPIGCNWAITGSLAGEAGVYGAIKSGPINVNGEKFWTVDFYDSDNDRIETSTVNESVIDELNTTESIYVTKFNNGDKVIILGNIPIKSDPDDSAENITEVNYGDTAYISTISWLERLSLLLKFIGLDIKIVTFEDGKWWWRVTYGNYAGWVPEEYLEEYENITFSVESVENLYGAEYGRRIMQSYEDDGYPYHLKSYDQDDNELASQPLPSSRIIYYDTFDPANPGGIIVLDEGTSDVIINTDNIDEITMNYQGNEIVLPFTSNCQRTCGKEGEFVNKSLGETCCSGLMQIWQYDGYNSGLFVCTNCGDGICSSFENNNACWEDCP